MTLGEFSFLLRCTSKRALLAFFKRRRRLQDTNAEYLSENDYGCVKTHEQNPVGKSSREKATARERGGYIWTMDKSQSVWNDRGGSGLVESLTAGGV